MVKNEDKSGVPADLSQFLMSILAKKKHALQALSENKIEKTSNETYGGGTTKKLAQRRKIAKFLKDF